MDVDELLASSLESVAAHVAAGTVSAVEVVDAALQRAAATEGQVHAFAALDADGARAAARSADRRRRAGGALGPLHGVPVGVKDVIWTADLPTEGGSAVLAGFRPPADATVVARLRDAGAIVLGKTVTHEFAWGQNVPPTRCPWDAALYPGGSSAGSGVAVAVGSLFAAVGTDTAGSIRNPAAVNGLVGLKPTHGLVSRAGVSPVSPSLDAVGPITRTVADCAIVLAAIVGHDPRDPASRHIGGTDFRRQLGKSVAGMRVGVDRRQAAGETSAEVSEAVEAALETLQALGAAIVEVELPDSRDALAAGLVLAYAESAEWHRPLLHEYAHAYAQGTRLTLELGSLVAAADYLNAQAARFVVRDSLRQVFEEHALDVLAGPTMPSTTIPLDRLDLDFTRPDAADHLAGVVQILIGANVSGLPALSVSCGASAAGMPIGLHLTGRPFAEGAILRLAYAFEQATSWHERVPVSVVGAR
jgi:aspartyl-tRNA(Asn)/glutamyl-tRNA(Gln) amidotransferase subunit A